MKRSYDIFVSINQTVGTAKVSKATRYRDFSYPSRSAPGPTQSPIGGVLRQCPGGKRPRRGVDHPPPSSAEVKEGVELYFYSACRPSWPVMQ